MGRRQTKHSIPVAERISDGERKERKEGKEGNGKETPNTPFLWQKGYLTEKEKKGKKEKKSKKMGRRQTKHSIPVAERISDLHFSLASIPTLYNLFQFMFGKLYLELMRGAQRDRESTREKWRKKRVGGD
jgi:hypothetical protein